MRNFFIDFFIDVIDFCTKYGYLKYTSITIQNYHFHLSRMQYIYIYIYVCVCTHTYICVYMHVTMKYQLSND